VAKLGIQIYENFLNADIKQKVGHYIVHSNLVLFLIENSYENLKPAYFTFLAHYSEAVIEGLKNTSEYDFIRGLSILLPYFTKHNSV
jgi:hypothetical protein